MTSEVVENTGESSFGEAQVAKPFGGSHILSLLKSIVCDITATAENASMAMQKAI